VPLIHPARNRLVEGLSAFASVDIPGDVNGDGKVDCIDIAIVKASFGKTKGSPGFDVRADMNMDCVVNIKDLAYVSQNLPAGRTCP